MPALTTQVDRAKAARYGINVSDVLDTVESIGGRTSGVVYGDDNSVLTSGGEGGIRTPDALAGMPHFECGAFNRSATSPKP